MEKKKVDLEGLVDDELSEDLLARLGDLARRQMDLEDQIEAANEELRKLGDDHRRISEEDIPAVLDETGLSEVRLSDGTKVRIKENLRVATAGKNREPINAWLEQEGHDDVIKDEVVALFGKGEGERAAALVLAAEELTDAVNRKRYVNPQTFAALLRELMADGVDVLLDELGVFVQRQTKLDRP